MEPTTNTPGFMIRRFRVARYWHGRTAVGMLGVVFATAGPISVPAGMHPVHASSTQADLSRDKRSLDVTVRFFTDDLEVALKAAGRPTTIATAQRAVVDSALSAYLSDRLQFGFDDGPLVRGRVIRHQREDDVTVVFIQVPMRRVPTRLRVQQRAMLDLFEDQANVLLVRVGAKKRSALLRRGHELAEFELQ